MPRGLEAGTRRNAIITIAVTDHEKETLYAGAAKVGVKPSAWLRKLGLEIATKEFDADLTGLLPL